MLEEELYNYKLMSPVVRLIKWPSVHYSVGDEKCIDKFVRFEDCHRGGICSDVVSFRLVVTSKALRPSRFWSKNFLPTWETCSNERILKRNVSRITGY